MANVRAVLSIAPLAPAGRLHPSAHRSDTRATNPYGKGYVLGGGFGKGHVFAVP